MNQFSFTHDRILKVVINRPTAIHAPVYVPASEMTYIVSGGALNSTHSLTPVYV